jgi:hypothetical protein
MSVAGSSRRVNHSYQHHVTAKKYEEHLDRVPHEQSIVMLKYRKMVSNIESTVKLISTGLPQRPRFVAPSSHNQSILVAWRHLSVRQHVLVMVVHHGIRRRLLVMHHGRITVDTRLPMRCAHLMGIRHWLVVHLPF